ncbi:MAG: hypothetical protein PVH24_02190, partial [Candidatus Zixiibacteriota bacterium]
QTAIYVEGGESITQGGGFVSWHHYFRPAGRTFFTTTGLGFYTWRSGSNNYNHAGGGMLTGGGYEFSRHWQVGLFISAGWSTLGYRQMIHTTVHLIVGGVVF